MKYRYEFVTQYGSFSNWEQLIFSVSIKRVNMTTFIINYIHDLLDDATIGNLSQK